MGFGNESLTKHRSLILHRAAIRGLEEAGRDELYLSRREWESYCARAGNVGSRISQKNLDFRLESLGLIEVHEDGSVMVLRSDYSDILLDE